MKPRLIYDGECGLCRYLVNYSHAVTRDLVEYATYQDVAPEYPDIGLHEFERSIQLVDAGTRRDGAEAAFATLAVGGQAVWLWMYSHLPGFSSVSESLYTFVSTHRSLSFKLIRPLFGPSLEPRTHRYVADLLLRSIGICALLAFCSLWWQIDGLIGSAGVLPARDYLEAVGDYYGLTRFWWLPTMLWLAADDWAMHALAATGSIAALLLIVGRLRLIGAVGAYLCYLSLVNAGQDFTAFQWDILLLECLVAGAVATRAPTLGIWIFRLLLFQFMLLAGAAKLLSGDLTWAGGSALMYHFETQPLPTWIAWYAHHLPHKVLEFGSWATLFVEVVVPFLIFLPRRPRLAAGVAFLVLELLILLTGSYNFFNLLTVALCVSLLDDDLAPARLNPLTSNKGGRPTKAFATMVVILGLATTWSSLHRQPAFEPARWVSPWRIVNSYGLFAVMTTSRYELTIEGSSDGFEWRTYEFPFKPGALTQAPRLATPHQPRLDWQMWFAALGEPRHSPWIYDLVFALLEGKPAVTRLLESPFAEPPTFVRITRRLYTFTDPTERAETGHWWRAGEPEIWLAPVQKRQPIITHDPLTLD